MEDKKLVVRKKYSTNIVFLCELVGYRMSGPAKFEIREFVRIILPMIDFLEEKHRPFTAIAKEAVRLGIIRSSEVDHFYWIFTIVQHGIHIFEGIFYPYDQTSTGRDRWEWKLPDNMTEEKMMQRINEYVRMHFKTPLYRR